MPEHDDRSVLQRLFDLGDGRVGSFTDEILANPRFAEVLENALKGALETKGRVDRNMQTVLNLLNVPSKADYKKLVTKIDALQGGLVNLNIKLDRILAAQERAAAPKPRRAPRAAKPKRTPESPAANT